MIEIADFVSGEKAELHAMRRQAVHSRCANDYTLEQRQGWVPDGLCEDTWRARFQEYRPVVARLPGSEFRKSPGLPMSRPMATSTSSTLRTGAPGSAWHARYGTKSMSEHSRWGRRSYFRTPA